MKHIGDRNCGVFSLPNRLTLYQNYYNFKVNDSKQLVVFAGIPQNIENINVLIDKNQEIKEFKPKDTQLLSKIIEFDTKVHKQSRQQLLTSCLNGSDCKTFAILDKINDQMTGFGCIRTNIDGIAIIGPVYADNDSIAEILIYNLIKYCETSQTNGFIYPTLNCCQSSQRIARKLSLLEFSSSPTLFTKSSPPLSDEYIYCIHSPNFSF